MATAQIDAKASDHRGLKTYNTNYTTAHNAANGSISGYDWIGVGQAYTGGYYNIYRYFMTFDISTAEIPSNALLQSAYLRVYYTGNPSGFSSQFQIIIKKGDPLTYPHYPLVVGDYYYDYYTGNGGDVDTEDIPDGKGTLTVLDIDLNTTGKSWISFTDTDFGLALFSSRDVSVSIPTGSEWLKLYESPSNPTIRPALFITYFIPTGIPAVGDPTYSAKATYAVATATVSDAGGGYTERGFEYGIAEESTWAVRATGVWGATGNYSLTLPNLLPETTYYGRAFITNEYGTAYSEWTSFTTTATPSYGVYSEANTASYRLYVSDDEAIAWRGYKGPYSGKQTLINISDITNKTKGVKVLKVDLPDANTKGNFHICISVKEELKS